MPRVYAEMRQTENCTGDYIYHSHNVNVGFDVNNCQDVSYIEESKNVKDSYDIFILEDAALCYDVRCCHILYNSNFCYGCVSSSDLEYCDLVMNSKNCFGCVGINHRQFCILNEQYSREEYFVRVAEIKREMGSSYGREFFRSTYPIEDTVAMWERF